MRTWVRISTSPEKKGFEIRAFKNKEKIRGSSKKNLL
jgi:hypothetical protein